MIKDFFNEFPILSTVFIIILLVLAFFITDGVVTKSEPFYGYVIDKQYKAENNSTGIGYGITNKGNNGIIVTTVNKKEQFLIMVKIESGKIVTVNCKPELYYKKEINQKIECSYNKGYFTHIVWSKHGIR